MLYKDNERYVLKDADKKKVKDFVQNRFPVHIVYPKSFFYETFDQDGKKHIASKQLAIIPYEEQVEMDGVITNWKYMDSPPMKNKHGELEFYKNCDPCLKFKGSLSTSNMELLFFLIEISKCGTHSKQTKGGPVFEIVNTARLAKLAMDKERQETQVKAALVGAMAINESELLRVAAAFSVPLTAGMTDDEQRYMVLNAVKTREQNSRDGFETFLQVINAEERNEVLEKVAKAKSMGVIAYMPKDSKWILVDDMGKRIADLCKINKGHTPDDGLVFQMLNDEEAANALIVHVDNYSRALAKAE